LRFLTVLNGNSDKIPDSATAAWQMSAWPQAFPEARHKKAKSIFFVYNHFLRLK
jgi:hypothetical protein